MFEIFHDPNHFDHISVDTQTQHEQDIRQHFDAQVSERVMAARLGAFSLIRSYTHHQNSRGWLYYIVDSPETESDTMPLEIVLLVRQFRLSSGKTGNITGFYTNEVIRSTDTMVVSCLSTECVLDFELDAFYSINFARLDDPVATARANIFTIANDTLVFSGPIPKGLPEPLCLSDGVHPDSVPYGVYTCTEDRVFGLEKFEHMLHTIKNEEPRAFA